LPAILAARKGVFSIETPIAPLDLYDPATDWTFMSVFSQWSDSSSFSQLALWLRTGIKAYPPRIAEKYTQSSWVDIYIKL